jgi:hypothetical protein
LTTSRSGADTELARKSRIREGRIFALTVAGGFLAVALLAMYRSRDRVEHAGFTLSAIAVLAGLLVPGRLGPARRAWMKLGEVIGSVTTPIIMAILYYIVVTPIALMRRMAKPRGAATDSSWHQRAPLPPRERMERQF